MIAQYALALCTEVTDWQHLHFGISPGQHKTPCFSLAVIRRASGGNRRNGKLPDTIDKS